MLEIVKEPEDQKMLQMTRAVNMMLDATENPKTVQQLALNNNMTGGSVKKYSNGKSIIHTKFIYYKN